MSRLNNRNTTRTTKAVRAASRSIKRTVDETKTSTAVKRRKGSFLSYVMTLIVMLVMVVLVYFGDEIKAKVFGNDTAVVDTEVTVTFRNETLLDDHFEKHGKEMGFADAKSYEEAASKVVENRKSLHKTEAEDGDDVYYLESTNEIVIVSSDGYIRTYFCPEDGIEYYNRQ